MKKKKLTKEERRRYDSLLKMMKRYEKRGVEITLAGETLSLEEIAAVCAVKEHGSYMGDFVWDEEGELSEAQGCRSFLTQKALNNFLKFSDFPFRPQFHHGNMVYCYMVTDRPDHIK